MIKYWFQHDCPSIKPATLDAARAHQLNLTKPAGSLGLLEDVAVSFCGWQDTLTPTCDLIKITVFAADHGVCAQGVSAFPQQVTTQMLHNFIVGGAAISVLAKSLKADFDVVNAGIVNVIDDADSLINKPIAFGTKDFSQYAAMSEEEMLAAIELGRNQAPLTTSQTQLFIGGDMGIGNTTSASAIYSLLLKLPPSSTVGPGTGVDQEGISRKQQLLDQAFALHSDQTSSGLGILQCVGGFEVAALVGAYIASAQAGIPILIDGFIATAAALLAVDINASSRDWMMFSHQSDEPAHRYALDYLNAKPLLDIGMRLGEGSGAAVAVPLIKAALDLHTNMATFDNAGVSENHS